MEASNTSWKALQSLIAYNEGGVLSKVILRTQKQHLTLFCMAKGTEISDHTSTKEGFVIVLEGKGVFILEGEPISMQPGVIIFLKKDIVHSLHAEENTSFLLSLI